MQCAKNWDAADERQSSSANRFVGFVEPADGEGPARFDLERRSELTSRRNRVWVAVDDLRSDDARNRDENLQLDPAVSHALREDIDTGSDREVGDR